MAAVQFRNRLTCQSAWIIAAGMIVGAAAIFCPVMPATATPAEQVSPAVLFDVVAGNTAELAAIDSNAAAITLFTSAIGPSLGLKDATGILSAKGLSAQMVKELGLVELAQSAHELMAALAAWQLAESVHRTQTANPPSVLPTLPPPARQEWMNGASRLLNLGDFFRLMADQPVPDSSSSTPQTQQREMLFAAHQLAFEAQQRAMASWWSLYNWKERVRQARGLARLCGTWQWTLHNHQNHREQKMVMLFPPPGYRPDNIPLPAETIVLGDSIYIRWERGGYVEEDSLLFVQDGHKKDRQKDTLRIEGSFVNNTGGWGSIVGKRTADCQS